jgi:hypothetical protein
MERVIALPRSATHAPGRRKPQLIPGHHCLRSSGQRREVRGRASIADVDPDDAVDAIRPQHRVLIAEKAAPVVEEKGDRAVGADSIDDLVKEV